MIDPIATPPFPTSPGPEARTVRQLLELQARRQGRATAFLGFDRASLSRAELAAKVERGRRQLLDLGVGRGDRVALMSEHHTESAVAFLTVASLATCAPLRPRYSGPELEQYFGQLRATAIILDKGRWTTARQTALDRGLPIIELDTAAASAVGTCRFEGTTQGEPRRDRAPEESDIALVLQTTGSTARPKLVPFTQSSLMHIAWGTARALALDESDRCLTFMPLFHVHGLVSGMLVPLTAGGSVACVGTFDSDAYFRWLKALHPTWYSTSPAIHQIILREGRRRSPSRFASSLRFVRSGSAVLPGPVARGLEQLFGVPVIEAYGMTEIPNISGNPVSAPRRGSVGRSAGPEIAILGADSVPQPRGTVGEIAVRGASLTPGYENAPEANATAFREGWFLTGDLGLIDDDGYLFLRGRKKEQINRGGDKIAPIEVDEALAAHPAVEQAVAFGLPHPALGEDLVAVVVCQKSTRVCEADLLDHLRRTLAPHKIPTRILPVTEIPLADTGKPQRSRVARQWHEYLACSSEVTKSLPETPSQHFVAKIWRDVLALADIGIDDDLFALGATSLDMAAVASRLERELAETIHLPLLLAEPTVRRLARGLEAVYGSALSRVLNLPATAETDPPPGIDQASVARLRAHLAPAKALRKPVSRPGKKNPRAIFVLSAPRSGSTLLRAMLAGHPELFAPPELRLLHDETLDAWRRRHDGAFTFLREGLLRAWMALLGLSFEQAATRLERRAEAGTSVQSTYGEIQQWLDQHHGPHGAELAGSTAFPAAAAGRAPVAGKPAEDPGAPTPCTAHSLAPARFRIPGPEPRTFTAPALRLSRSSI